MNQLSGANNECLDFLSQFTPEELQIEMDKLIHLEAEQLAAEELAFFEAPNKGIVLSWFVVDIVDNDHKLDKDEVLILNNISRIQALFIEGKLSDYVIEHENYFCLKNIKKFAEKQLLIIKDLEQNHPEKIPIDYYCLDFDYELPYTD